MFINLRFFWVDLDGDKSKDEGEEFIIWSWKGDYMNLGAGAETGIYQVKDGEFDEYGNYIMEMVNTHIFMPKLTENVLLI